jgi:hypothetical protein
MYAESMAGGSLARKTEKDTMYAESLAGGSLARKTEKGTKHTLR